MQQVTVSRCFRFPVMLVSRAQYEGTPFLVAGSYCSLSTSCMAVHLLFVFVTARAVVKFCPGGSVGTAADSRNRFP